MTSIGETLRRERLRRGWELGKVSAETKIGLHLLEAIETDQFDRLPGGVFAKSFIRQYANVLGLEEDDLAAELKARFEEPAEPAPEPQHSTVHLPRMAALQDFRDRMRSNSSASAFVSLIAVILVCAGVYSFWQNGRAANPDPRPVSQVHAPRSVSRPAPAAEPGRAPDSGNGVETSSVAEPASLRKSVAPAAPPDPPKSDFRPAEVSESGTIKVSAATVARVEQLEQPAAVPVSLPSAVPPAPTESSASRAPLRVAFTATEPVWLSIKSDGNRTFSGTLAAHESRELEAERKITMLIGNAGGVKIKWNGKPVGVIGPPGQIQLLVLTPQGAHIVPRTPPAPAAAARP